MNSIILRDVEVTSINPVLKKFTLIVHVKAAPIQMHTPEVQQHIATRVKFAVRYLVREGFISDPIEDQMWHCVVSGICHP